MFRDLAGLAIARTRLSTFALESESVVEPSSFIDDVPGFGLPTEHGACRRRCSRLRLRGACRRSDGDRIAMGARPRRRTPTRDRARFRVRPATWVLPRVSVSRLERYMKCPFQFYVANVLQVAEEPEDETSRSPLERGRFLHELFETFFHEWQARGRGRITAADMARRARCSKNVAGRRCGRCRRPKPGSSARGCSDRRSARASPIACSRWKPNGAPSIRERLMEYELDGDVHVYRRRRRGARRAAAREDRSRRPARRRHVQADRLQDEVRARSPAGAAAADLQRVRSRHR